MILIRVDLPAPLSPARARTSPERRVKETSFNAWTPPNRFDTWSTSSSGEESMEPSLSIWPIPSYLLLNLVHQYRDNDHDPDGDKLPERFDIAKARPILNHSDDQCANDGSDDGSRTPKEASPSDHHSGDTVQ